MIESFIKFLQHQKRVSKHTLLAYENDLTQFLSFLQYSFSENKTEAADYGMVRSWIVSLVEAGIEPSSVNRKIACLRSYFKYLLKQEIISKDPMLRIKVLKTKKKLPTFIHEGDMANVLDQDLSEDTFESWRNKLIIELFYATGIRLSELINLREENIDLHNQTIKVLGKRNKERVIPFPGSISSIIKTYKQKRNQEVELKNHGFLLVTKKGDPCYAMLIYKIVKNHLGERTHVEKKSPHVLRHTYATHLLDKGAEINAVKELLGHTSLAATQVYTHNSMEKLKKVFEQAHPKA